MAFIFIFSFRGSFALLRFVNSFSAAPLWYGWPTDCPALWRVQQVWHWKIFTLICLAISTNVFRKQTIYSNELNQQRKRQRMKNARDFVACTICGGAWCTNVPSVPPAQGHECRLMLFEVKKIFFILIQAACRRVGWEENGYSCSCRSRRGNCCWCCRLENEWVFISSPTVYSVKQSQILFNPNQEVLQWLQEHQQFSAQQAWEPHLYLYLYSLYSINT